MVKNEALNIKIDPQIKEKFVKTCDEIGIQPEVAVNIFLNKFVKSGGFPFAVTTSSVPNPISKTSEANNNKSANDAKTDTKIPKTVETNNKKINTDNFNPQATLDEVVTDQSAWHQFFIAFDPIINYFLNHKNTHINLLKLSNRKIYSFNKEVFKNKEQADHWVTIVNNFASKQLLNKVLQTFHLKLTSKDDDYMQSWDVDYVD